MLLDQCFWVSPSMFSVMWHRSNLASSQSCKQGHRDLSPLYLVISLLIWHTTTLAWRLKNRNRHLCIDHFTCYFVSLSFPQAFNTGKGSSPLFSFFFYLSKFSLSKTQWSSLPNNASLMFKGIQTSTSSPNNSLACKAKYMIQKPSFWISEPEMSSWISWVLRWIRVKEGLQGQKKESYKNLIY